MKECKICKKEFKKNSNSQSRCVECQKIKCLFCERKFIPKTRNYKAKYCSRKCANNSKKGKEPEALKNNRGIKPRTYHLRKRDKYGNAFDREWRETIFKRDNWVCQFCNIKGRKLQAHHIKSYREYPRLRHNLDNGITLCLECHSKTETYGWSKYWHKKIAARRIQSEAAQGKLFYD